MTNTPNTVGDRAGDAQRQARSLSARRQALWTVATAALIAFVYGQPPKIWTCAVFLGAVIVMLVARKYWQRRHGARSDRRWSELSPARRVTSLGMIVVLIVAATALKSVLPPGTAQSFGVQFLSALTLLGVGQAVPAYLDRRDTKRPLPR
jgi:O-antigen/teichoic acid export membrane protein